jgi:trehalose 6-phosphate phosphatase
LIREDPPSEQENARRLEVFWGELAAARDRVLMLDYDGTLSPFRVERDEAEPYPGVRQVLSRLPRAAGRRLVIVSGRRVDEVRALLGLNFSYEVHGAHGRERLTADGRIETTPPGPEAAAALDRAGKWARQRGWAERLEPKPGCLAFHWRGTPAGEARAMEAEVGRAWGSVAELAGLELKPFDGGLELRAAGEDKGRAVSRILAASPPEAAAAYLGDDLTDEDAFAALDGRGRTLTALVRSEWRPSRAWVWLRPPGDLLEFLDRWTRTGGNDR